MSYVWGRRNGNRSVNFVETFSETFVQWDLETARNIHLKYKFSFFFFFYKDCNRDHWRLFPINNKSYNILIVILNYINHEVAKFAKKDFRIYEDSTKKKKILESTIKQSYIRNCSKIAITAFRVISFTTLIFFHVDKPSLSGKKIVRIVPDRISEERPREIPGISWSPVITL